MSKGTLKPIETRYAGCRFRSRLEARWAVFFDTLGIKWEYEKEGYDLGPLGWYLPDFWLPVFRCFAEVKPELLDWQQWQRCAALPRPCVILDGVPARQFWAITQPLNGDEEWVAVRFGDDENSSSEFNWYRSGIDMGRVEWGASKDSGRLWFCFGERIDDYGGGALEAAYTAARSARFEYGESR